MHDITLIFLPGQYSLHHMTSQMFMLGTVVCMEWLGCGCKLLIPLLALGTFEWCLIAVDGEMLL
jgi:hypothetical protein